jgi:hypothetical protein
MKVIKLAAADFLPLKPVIFITTTLFTKHLLDSYCIPDTILASGDAQVNNKWSQV